MKKIYLDCGMGAAGDMLTAALYELLGEADKQRFVEIMNSLLPGKVTVSVRPETKCGILGSHFEVLADGAEEHSHDHHEHDHEHHDHEHTHDHHDHGHTHDHHHGHGHHHAHHSMADVEEMISSFSGINEDVKKNITDVYKIIAKAESTVHGTDVSEIHFHEVGMLDAVADVAAVCILMDMLSPDELIASPVRVGRGHVRCAHGIIPVPAPAAAEILKGIPTYAGNIEAELCTPTGAALLKHFASEFSEQPLMTIEKIGYGMGSKNFEVCNCVRALLQES